MVTLKLEGKKNPNKNKIIYLDFLCVCVTVIVGSD